MTEQQPPADDPANEPRQATLEDIQQFVAAAVLPHDVGYTFLMWTRDDEGNAVGYYSSHNFPTWVDAAKWIQPTVNKLLADERKAKGPSIILPSGAGHPRRIPR